MHETRLADRQRYTGTKVEAGGRELGLLKRLHAKRNDRNHDQLPEVRATEVGGATRSTGTIINVVHGQTDEQRHLKIRWSRSQVFSEHDCSEKTALRVFWNSRSCFHGARCNSNAMRDLRAVSQNCAELDETFP